jgi:glycine/D-amino acid oxidase-like deaminating enzyme
MPDRVRNDPAPSYWLALTAYTPGPPLAGEVSVDVVICGGGFTGLWTAIFLKRAEPALRIVVIERDSVGHGASGRNGGFATSLVQRSLAELARALGDEDARALHRAAVAAVWSLRDFVEAEGIDCDLMPNGALVVSSGPEQNERIAAEVRTAERLGVGGLTYLDRATVQAEIHSETFRCGLADEACVLVDPAKLVRGLRDVAVRLGVAVYEGTPVAALRQAPGGVAVDTPGGRVRAERALLAANAYSTGFAELRRYVLPFYSYIVLTRRLTDAEWARVGWERRQGVEDRRTFLHYPRPTIDGRILWGGRDAAYHPDGPRPDYDRDARIFARLEETFRWTFPQLRDVSFEHRWGGPIAVMARFIPASGWLEGHRVAYGFGYNGHGVAVSHLNGQVLRDLLLDRRTDLTELAIVRRKPIAFPPAPVRDPLVRAAVRALQRCDDEGRPAREPFLLRALNRLFG